MRLGVGNRPVEGWRGWLGGAGGGGVAGADPRNEDVIFPVVKAVSIPFLIFVSSRWTCILWMLLHMFWCICAFTMCATRYFKICSQKQWNSCSETWSFMRTAWRMKRIMIINWYYFFFLVILFSLGNFWLGVPFSGVGLLPAAITALNAGIVWAGCWLLSLPSTGLGVALLLAAVKTLD